LFTHTTGGALALPISAKFSAAATLGESKLGTCIVIKIAAFHDLVINARKELGPIALIFAVLPAAAVFYAARTRFTYAAGTAAAVVATFFSIAATFTDI
jgi:hypothetical protein